MEDYFKTLKQIIEGDDAITFLSGAGLSTAAGLPDFRSDAKGFWTKNKPVHFADYLNSAESRKKSWQNNIAIHHELTSAKPTKMHALIEKALKRNHLNSHITQNIDGLHTSEECLPDQIIEIHGTTRKAACLNCYEEYDVKDFYEEYSKADNFPLCPKCQNGYVKVATISFGQQLDSAKLSLAKEKSSQCRYFIVMGSSLKVSPANHFPRIALNNNAKLIILNYDSTPFDSAAEFVINEKLENIYEQISK